MRTGAAWGKFSERDGRKHPLADHCLDVAIVFRLLLDLPLLARITNLNPAQQARLAVLAFLHDFGKCNHGFQSKSDPAARLTAGHVMEAAALLLDLSDQWTEAWTGLITEICGWFVNEEQAAQMLLASISHHGRPVSLNDYGSSGAVYAARKWWGAMGGYDPKAQLDILAGRARTAFPDAFGHDVPAIDAVPELQQRFAGLLMLADWIGSDTQFFPYRQSADEDRFQVATVAAGRALRAIGLMPPDQREVNAFQAIFPFSPTPLQAALAEDIDVSGDTQLLLAESDTGSGKTEAALAWFFRLYASGRVDGLYFALPTRVAARELYDRVLRAVRAAFDDGSRPGPVLLAAPGYVKVDGQTIGQALTDPNGTLWNDDAMDGHRERLWSSERPKRFLAAPIAVGTIDQALLSALQVRHSLLRSVCLDRHLLVVDEVHASDPYMREILQALLRGHLRRGGHALLLSATLGESAAALYFDRDMASLDEALTRPYPLLSARNRTWPMPVERQRHVTVELCRSLTADDALLPPLISAINCGARVLVVCNTVSRANALFRCVESALADRQPSLLPALFAFDGVRCPHHGRFAREDRALLDGAVTQQLGKGSRDGARLLIGTQTLEQSLDIDADWLVTDLAPMDVLIQRLGRLHRHVRTSRPSGFESPRVLVRVPEHDLLAYLRNGIELRAPAGLGSVYSDGRVLARTWDELTQRTVLNLPLESRELIERTTHGEALDSLPDAWRMYGEALAGKVHAEIFQALRSVQDDEPFGELHYPDKSERVLTRLGRPTLELPLFKPMRSPFGSFIHQVTLPAHWLPGDLAFPDVVRAEPTDDGFCFSIGKAIFRYSRFGLEKDDA